MGEFDVGIYIGGIYTDSICFIPGKLYRLSICLGFYYLNGTRLTYIQICANSTVECCGSSTACMRAKIFRFRSIPQLYITFNRNYVSMYHVHIIKVFQVLDVVLYNSMIVRPCKLLERSAIKNALSNLAAPGRHQVRLVFFFFFFKCKMHIAQYTVHTMGGSQADIKLRTIEKKRIKGIIFHFQIFQFSFKSSWGYPTRMNTVSLDLTEPSRDPTLVYTEFL